MSPLQKKLRLSDEALVRISEAVAAAEKSTDGEIVVAVAKESSRYSFWELLASVLSALVVFAALLPCAGIARSWFESKMWTVPDWYLVALYGVTVFGLIAAFFQVANVPFIDRIVVPRFVQEDAVSARAFRLFSESGVHNTAHHSGILIYLSLLEKQVRILADSGISARISADLWALISDDIAADMSCKSYESAILNGIEKCGQLLSQYYPAQKSEGDELPNGLILLENAGWA
ncbi:MAG: TPM domain-containing protein [Treponema sp.]|nr:TPM domain-containing protein [Treponema sp.]